MKDKLNKVLDRATDYSGSKKRKFGKGLLLGVIILLLGTLGLELSNNDFDLGSVFSGESISDSKIERDESGNLERTEDGGFLTKILRDKEGNVVEAGTEGAKYTDEYNCEDFVSQPEAQTFFQNAGGPSEDTNRLDGDNDGQACEALPKGSSSEE